MNHFSVLSYHSHNAQLKGVNNRNSLLQCRIQNEWNREFISFAAIYVLRNKVRMFYYSMHFDARVEVP